MDNKKIKTASEEKLSKFLIRLEEQRIKLSTLYPSLLERTWKPPLRKKGDEWDNLQKKADEVEKALRKIKLLIKNVRYWYGKRKSEHCLAFVRGDRGAVRCRIFHYGAPWEAANRGITYQSLYANFCSYCTLKPSQIKRRVQWAIILGV